MNDSMTAPAPKPRILVVEDETIVARDIQFQLEALGYQPAGHAITGEQAVALAGELRPDLVLMDVQLAGAMDGITASELIRAQYGIPVVFLTAFATDETVSRAETAEPFGYILKPFAERELRIVLEMALYRHLVETRLRASEERARTLIEWTPEAIIVHRDGQILYVNPAAIVLFGAVSAKDLIDTSLLDRIHPSSLLFVRERMHNLALHGTGAPMTVLKCLRLDGTTVEVESQGTVIAYDGAPAIHTSMRDITARVQTEAALRRSEAHNRSITQSAHDAIVTADSAGNVVGWNSGAELIFGYAEAEVLDRAVARLIPERFVDAHREGMERIGSGGPPRVMGKTVELIGRRKNGDEFPLDLSLAQWETPDGRFVTGIIRDITERKRAEAALHLKSAALEAAANAIVITDREGTIEWANTAFTTFTGYTVAEAVGRKPGALLKSGKHDRAFYQNLWNTILTGSVWRGEMINRRKDGSFITEEMLITPLKNDAGRISHFIAVKQDITERKRLEEQFRQAQKMESIGRLAGGVAHDFNNMLGVILGNLELALPRVDPSQPLHAELREIQDAAERSAVLTRQLLAFARRQPTAPKELDLNRAVTQMLPILQRMVGENVSIVVAQADGLWRVSVDPSQLDQILANLIVNARDAIADVGTVTITTTNCIIDPDYAAHVAVTPGEYVRVAVGDNGCGMTAAVLEHVFEPFFTTKAVGVGTGLGLSTVYGSIRQNAGFVTVSSEPEVGTTFEFCLPRHQDEASPVWTPTEKRSAARGWETILIVEDEVGILKLATKALTAAGYTVLAGSSPEEGIRLAAGHAGEIHLLLTDVIMPGMNGQEMANALLAGRPALRCLFMSGYPAEVMSQSGTLPEGVSFIQKPFMVADLRTKVREILDAD